VQFSEPAFKGNLVSIGLDPRGFPVRRTLNPRNDEGLPIIRIFTLGGSTTFGYNVSDEHTWPSHLSSILNEKSKAEGIGIHVEVVNYGRGYYTPSQETLLLTDLLKSGHRPNVAIFMDGVNLGSSQDIPAFSEKLDRWFTGLQFRNDTSLLDALTWMPIVRLSRSIGHSVFDKNGNPEKAATRNKEKKWDKENVQNMVNRFEQNREISSAICKLYSVECYFMLQPNPLYNYPLKLYRMSLGESYMEGREIAQQFYERMRGEKGILWLADLFESWGHDRKAIVDDLHYSPGFNHFLAQHVAKHMDMKSLSPKAEIINEAAVTGSSRRLSEMGTRGNR
jgi:lysophospholipase L1-like esterase